MSNLPDPAKSPDEQAEEVRRTWRITATLFAAMLPLNSTPPQVGSKLAFASRIAPRVVQYPDMTMAFLPMPEGSNPERELPPGWEQFRLIADMPGSGDPLPSVESVIGVLEVVVDTLSFELGSPIRVGQMEAFDITAPVAIDDDREVRTFTGPPFGTNIRSVEMDTVAGATSVTLPDEVAKIEVRTAAALRWFYKSMTTDLSHDVFIFLWIALEILADLSPISIQAPYLARCNHTIKHCPDCGTPTDKEVRGPTIKQFLITALGVEARTADSLWRMRQMMHGAVNFEVSKLQDLPKLIQPLRSAVAIGLKRSLGIDPTQAPLVKMSGFAINPTVALGGIRKVTAEDLRSLTEFIDLLTSPKQSEAPPVGEDQIPAAPEADPTDSPASQPTIEDAAGG